MSVFTFAGIGWLVVSPIVALIWGRMCAASLGGTEADRG